MRVLFLTPQLPHPPISGGVIKSRKLVEYLASRHELHLCTLLKGADADNVEAFRACVPLVGFHAESVSAPRSLANFVRSLAAGVPLSVYRNRAASMRALVGRMIGSFDAVFVDHFLMFQFVPRSFAGRVVVHQHNAEHVMWSRFAALERNVLRKLAIAAESRRIRNYESRIGQRAQVMLAAPNDIEALTAIGIPRQRFVETLHLGEEELLQRPAIEFARTERRLLYIGSLDWEANRDGLLWFLREVWPLLAADHAGLKLSIVGRNPGAALTREAQRHGGVELHGFVADLEPHYARSRVFIAPLRFGSGIKVKVINALYRGLPVVTTAVGAEGLVARAGREMFVAADAAAMARDIGVLLNDDESWSQMRDSARSLARREYSWEASLQQAERTLHD